jgi:hypothetical protein
MSDQWSRIRPIAFWATTIVIVFELAAGSVWNLSGRSGWHGPPLTQLPEQLLVVTIRHETQDLLDVLPNRDGRPGVRRLDERW